MCCAVFQADPLHLGLPRVSLPRFLRLLLLQRDAGGPALSAHILGLPHPLHDQKVYDWLCKSAQFVTNFVITVQ